jgi:hypothetical protein
MTAIQRARALARSGWGAGAGVRGRIGPAVAIAAWLAGAATAAGFDRREPTSGSARP